MKLVGRESLNSYRLRPQTPKCPALELYCVSKINYAARPKHFVEPSVLSVMGAIETWSLKLLENSQ